MLGAYTENEAAVSASAARCAIKMRSKDPDRFKAMKQLEKDLINGPLHCFGQHDKCSRSTAREKEQQSLPTLTTDTVTDTSDNINTTDDDADIFRKSQFNISPIRGDNMFGVSVQLSYHIQEIFDVQGRLWKETVAESPTRW